jgi:hypothetical protein
MYTIEKKYLLKLGGTGDPLASQSVEVPLSIDEVSQYLVCWVYTPGQISLGTGTIEIKRNGAVISTTAFAGNSIPVPLNLYAIGADFEMEMIHPQTTVARPVQSVWYYDVDAGLMVEDKDVVRWSAAPRPMPVSAVITNTDLEKKDLVLLWTALVWRNV